MAEAIVEAAMGHMTVEEGTKTMITPFQLDVKGWAWHIMVILECCHGNITWLVVTSFVLPGFFNLTRCQGVLCPDLIVTSCVAPHVLTSSGHSTTCPDLIVAPHILTSPRRHNISCPSFSRSSQPHTS